MLTETATTTNINEFFDIRPMNDWMREASAKPVPKQLFDDLWHEGEIAIMFGDTGKGKSALAVQIGESIARGRAFYPFDLTAKPRHVLLLDFEMSEKQIEMRYAADHDPKKGAFLKRKYDFSKRFHRVVVRPEILYRQGGKPLEEVLRELLQTLTVETGAKVIIIDNITYLKRTADSMREAVPLMKELQRLKRRFGLSILVIAHTRKRDIRRALATNDLQGSGVLANEADNIFAIGQSRRASGERYIKHLKPRNAEVLFDGSHVPVFKLKKIGGNFLGFEFQEFSSESVLLAEPRDGKDWPLIERIKELHDSGLTIRVIADQLEMSKSAVHRYLQMWHPPDDDDDNCVSSPTVREGASFDDEAPMPDAASNPYYFPGREEYDAAKAELDDMFDDENEDIHSQFRSRESYVLDCAAARARKEYLKTGVAPPLAEDEEYAAFKEAVRVYETSGGTVVHEPIAFIVQRFSHSSPPYEGGVAAASADGVVLSFSANPQSYLTAYPENHPPAEAVPLLRKEGSLRLHGPHECPFMYDGTPEAEAWFQHLVKLHPDRNDHAILHDYAAAEQWCRPPGAVSPYDPDDPFSKMKRTSDEYGNEIFVEYEYENGKRRVWYRYDSRGVLHRHEHNGDGSLVSPANPNLFGRFAKLRR